MKNPCNSPWQREFLELNCYHPALQALADAAQRFCHCWSRNIRANSLLVLSGNPNCAKTHTARAICRWCRQHPSTARARWRQDLIFVSWPRICDGLKEGATGVCEDLIETDLAVIDDIGAENDPWKIGANYLCQILSARERRFTVVTTNIGPEDWAEKFDARIADRLLRYSHVVNLFGVPSYALQTT